MELYHLFQQSVERYGERTSLTFEGMDFTYQDIANKANTVAHFLAKRLAGQRKNISLMIPNTPNFYFSLYGVLGAGCTVVPHNPLLMAEEVSVFLNHSDSELLIYDPVLKEKAVPIAQKAGLEAVDITEILQSGHPTDFLNPVVPPDESCMILYTSGTTGDPKGVVLTHDNIFQDLHGYHATIELTQDDTFICMLPMFHTFAMTTIVFGAMYVGAKVCLFPQFNPHRLIETTVQHPNVVFIAVPPMFHMMAKLAPDGIAQQHNIKYAISGGGPLPQDVVKAFKAKFDVLILEGYGLTETAPVVSVNKPETNKLGTIGKPFPGLETEVRGEETGQTLGTNEIGELCVRGPIVMKEYYKNPEQTAAVFYENGWFRTGDLASIDEEGYIKIVGRSKDLIVCGGENIYPREIEEHLLRYPGVMEAAVVGKPDTLRQEIPYAFVVLAEEARDKITESDIRRHCREHLAEYKIPEGFTFVESLPKTATNKIQKEKIKQQYFS
ncbi:AMP-binding protein [bacterium]|nr:AMP-binding protein [bacterium]